MRYLSVAILLFALLAACAPVPAQPTQEPALPTQAPPVGTATPEPVQPTPTPASKSLDLGEGQPVVVVRRGGGIAGVNDWWEIYANGEIKSSEGDQPSVSPDRVSQLVDDLDKLGFFEMDESYQSACADCFIYEITVNTASQSKTVSTYDPAAGAPPEVAQVVEAVLAFVK